MFSTYQFYSATGQLLDIVGVIILFYTGLPFKMPERDLYVEEIIKPEQEIKDKRQKNIAYLGLTLLLLGFGLQLIGTLLSIDK
jgi:hypothetical protein